MVCTCLQCMLALHIKKGIARRLDEQLIKPDSISIELKKRESKKEFRKFIQNK